LHCAVYLDGNIYQPKTDGSGPNGSHNSFFIKFRNFYASTYAPYLKVINSIGRIPRINSVTYTGKALITAQTLQMGIFLRSFTGRTIVHSFEHC
jgi:hypothetical protein